MTGIIRPIPDGGASASKAATKVGGREVGEALEPKGTKLRPAASERVQRSEPGRGADELTARDTKQPKEPAGAAEAKAGAAAVVAPGTVLPGPPTPGPLPPVPGGLPPLPGGIPSVLPRQDQSLTPSQQAEVRETLLDHGIPANEVDRIIQQLLDGVPMPGQVAGPPVGVPMPNILLQLEHLLDQVPGGRPATGARPIGTQSTG